jgi:NAD(P)-dependent dehydrogenase (short-subunit alcohol dehydrogenase family)
VYVQIAGMAPLGRIADPEDMGEAVLGAYRCKYMTGNIMVVDGGFSLVA